MGEEYPGGDPPCWAHLFEEPDTVHIRARRVFEPPDVHDGTRVLVDRTWPAGLEDGAGAIDLWVQSVGPSASLEDWFGYDRERWPEFQSRYRQELATLNEPLETLMAAARNGDLTLVYGARDDWFNHAVVLKAVLEQRLRS